MILLIVDTQNLIMNNNLYEFETFVYRIKTLIKEARNNNIEVIYVRHDDGVGQKLTKGALGYEIYEEFQPMPNERVFDKKLCLYDRELCKIRCHFFSAISMVVVGKAKSHPSLCTASIICRFSRFLACKKSARRVVVTYIRQRRSML